MSHTTNSMDNFTVQSVDFIVQRNTNIIDATTGIVSLTLVPDQGFELDAADFAGILPYPSGVLGIAFVQDGSNVLCNLSIDATFQMPASDLNIPICISGSATLLGISISGTIDLSTQNATPLPQSVPYSNNTGVEGVAQEIYRQTITADTDYYFSATPTISLTTGVAANYNLSIENLQFTNSRLTSVDAVVDYTFPFNNVSGDLIQVIANAIAVPVAPDYITGYSIGLTQPPEAVTRQIAIYGGVGADYTLTGTTNITFSNGTNVATGTIAASGVQYEEVNFAAVTQTQLDTIEITGDLDPSQPGSFWFIDILREVVSTIGIGGTATATPSPEVYLVQDELNSGTFNGGSDTQQSITFSHAVIGEDDRIILSWDPANPIEDADFIKTEDLPDGTFSVTPVRNVVDSYNLQLQVTVLAPTTGDGDMSYTIDLTPYVLVDYVTELVNLDNTSGTESTDFEYTNKDGNVITQSVGAGQAQLVCARLYPFPVALGTGVVGYTGTSC